MTNGDTTIIKKEPMTTNQFQLGSRVSPCEVLFPLNDRYDADKQWRTLAVVVPDDCVLMCPLKTSQDGRTYVNVKVSAEVTQGFDASLARGDKLMMIVVLYPWTFQGKQGESLRCRALERLAPGPKAAFAFE